MQQHLANLVRVEKEAADLNTPVRSDPESCVDLPNSELVIAGVAAQRGEPSAKSQCSAGGQRLGVLGADNRRLKTEN